MSSAIFDETSLDLIVRVYRGGTGRQHFNYYCIARGPDGIGMGSDSRVLLHKITEETDKLEGYTREVNWKPCSGIFIDHDDANTMQTLTCCGLRKR